MEGEEWMWSLQTLRFMLEGPKLSTIFSVVLIHVTKPKRFYWSVPRSLVNNLCGFCAVKSKQRGQKHTKKTYKTWRLLRPWKPFSSMCLIALPWSNLQQYWITIIPRADVRYIYKSLDLARKCARILVRGHCLFWKANSLNSRKTVEFQGQISQHIFAPNLRYCVYYS